MQKKRYQVSEGPFTSWGQHSHLFAYYLFSKCSLQFHILQTLRTHVWTAGWRSHDLVCGRDKMPWNSRGILELNWRGKRQGLKVKKTEISWSHWLFHWLCDFRTNNHHVGHLQHCSEKFGDVGISCYPRRTNRALNVWFTFTTRPKSVSRGRFCLCWTSAMQGLRKSATVSITHKRLHWQLFL